MTSLYRIANPRATSSEHQASSCCCTVGKNTLHAVCLRCGKPDLPTENGRVRCPNCQFVLTQKRYDKLLNSGTQIVLYGVKYRIEYEAQVATRGDLFRKYALRDPTIIEAAVAIIVSGILGNVAYDLTKTALTTLYTQLVKRRQRRKNSPSDRTISSEDLKFLYKMIGNEPEYAKQFIDYSKDYVNGRKSPITAVARACEEERVFNQYADILKNDPQIYVFSSQTGRCFHRKECHAITSPRKRIRLKKALLTPLLPCRRCKPL
ncbi:hypothetical protein Plim_2784 [Planctopirus limnophila DSM 3776]|uniref:Uncharacterized protein n=1 Tax=Planctopirus limnophila (strain ATCC 43296 / DSM 3776 / IFAM 1008 / Mu 290) TaxID=521674 RepID=D5SRB4_PLAL2|nr:hypothetical protein Plim_2784 [Planctopirus limnophila DSM 3776]